MRISSKGRYALAAVIQIAREGASGDSISLSDIAGALGISKLYLEQVFTQLKKRNIINSIKGAKGGYKFSIPPAKLTVWEVIESVENTIAERAEATVAEKAPDIEMALVSRVFTPLDETIQKKLESITIQDLLDTANEQISDQSFMLYM